MLIRNSYQLQDSQIIGGPSWLNADRFDIVAKANLESAQAFPVQRRDGPSQLQLMMRALLAERQLANTLSNLVGQAVVDRTGLAGNFDIDLTWTPEQTARRSPDTQDPPRANPDGPSIFTALQEQLGLKLESEKTPVDVLVIDHAEHPIEN